MDNMNALKVLHVNDNGVVTCNLPCDDAYFLDTLPQHRVSIAEFHGAVAAHWAAHHPDLASALATELMHTWRNRTHCVSTEASCAAERRNDDHANRCCDCKLPLTAPVCDPGRMVDPLRLDGR